MFSSSEYTNSLSSVYSEYADLERYNHDSRFGPPVRGLPQQFPVLLEQKNVYGYDALTHNNDEGQYLNVSSAYGNSCNPRYYVGNCPKNNPVRSFPPPLPTHAPLRESFQSSQNMVDKLKKYKILFFYDGSGRCPHSRAAVEEYKKIAPLHEIFTIKDIGIDANKKLLFDLGGRATPFFFSDTYKTSVTGFVKLQDLISSLETKNESYDSLHPLQKKAKDLQITVFVLPNCIFCHKLRQLFDKHGVSDFIKYIDAHDPAHKSKLANVRGFPHLVSDSTGKSITGYSDSVEDLFNRLQ